MFFGVPNDTFWQKGIYLDQLVINLGTLKPNYPRDIEVAREDVFSPPKWGAQNPHNHRVLVATIFEMVVSSGWLLQNLYLAKCWKSSSIHWKNLLGWKGSIYIFLVVVSNILYFHPVLSRQESWGKMILPFVDLSAFWILLFSFILVQKITKNFRYLKWRHWTL